MSDIYGHDKIKIKDDLILTDNVVVKINDVVISENNLIQKISFSSSGANNIFSICRIRDSKNIEEAIPELKVLAKKDIKSDDRVIMVSKKDGTVLWKLRGVLIDTYSVNIEAEKFAVVETVSGTFENFVK